MPGNVEIVKGTVKLRFNSKFYSISALRQTAEAYREICSSDITESDSFDVILIPKEKVELKALALEFSNYALGMMK